MNNRELHDELRNERYSLKEQLNQFYFDIEAIEVKMSGLAETIIREEQLLSKRPWRYSAPSAYGESCFSLNCLGSLYSDFPELAQLLKPGPHDDRGFCPMVKKNYRSEYTTSTVRLHFSDGSMRLTFDSYEVAEKFIKDFGLKIDLGGIEEERERIVSQLNNLDHVLAEAKQLIRE
jgi:hypothetical protein